MPLMRPIRKTALCAAVLVTSACAATPIAATASVPPLVGPALRQAMADTAHRFAADVIRDYNDAKKNQRRFFLGLKGVEVINVVYHAHNTVTGGTGQYLVEAVLVRDARGRLSPDRLDSVSIEEQDRLGSSDDMYNFQVAQLHHGRQWQVILNILRIGSSPLHYDYTTGRPSPSESVFPMTEAAWNPLASQAETIIAKAPHYAPLVPPAIPFAPPVYRPVKSSGLFDGCKCDNFAQCNSR